MPQLRKRRAKATDIPDSLRREVAERGQKLVSRKFEPVVALEGARRHHQFNYPVAVFAEWRGRCFYFCTKYRTPGGRPAADFVVRGTRLEYAGGGRFHLAYFRHTNRWCTVYTGLSLSESFDAIEGEELFWPVL